LAITSSNVTTPRISASSATPCTLKNPYVSMFENPLNVIAIEMIQRMSNDKGSRTHQGEYPA
jgi:hypothetical protein